MRRLLFCNPLNGALELFYYGINGSYLDKMGVLISACIALIFLVVGLLYFKKTETYFADLI
jgi:ABC-type polysaccharide/polyol phosphate export permease